MTAKIQQLAGIDRVVHEPARLMVVALLAADSRSSVGPRTLMGMLASEWDPGALLWGQRLGSVTINGLVAIQLSEF